MGNVIGNLTQGELVQVLGRFMEKIGEEMDAGTFVDGIDFGEVVDLVQGFVSDALKEYTDQE